MRAGYFAIVPEARAFWGSREIKAKYAGLKFVCDQWQHLAQLYGRTLLGGRVWDVMRLIVWAQSRDDTDMLRVAITGNSGGGTVSLFAAAMDLRISVCVPCSSYTPRCDTASNGIQRFRSVTVLWIVCWRWSLSILFRSCMEICSIVLKIHPQESRRLIMLSYYNDMTVGTRRFTFLLY